jgi:hypothetical protein
MSEEEAVPEVYRRWLSVDQPKNWTGPSGSLIEELWREKSDEQKEFWRSLTVAAAPEPKRYALVEQMGHRATVGTIRETTFAG